MTSLVLICSLFLSLVQVVYLYNIFDVKSTILVTMSSFIGSWIKIKKNKVLTYEKDNRISVAKGVCMIFVGIIHSDEPFILESYWLFRRIINKAVLILLVYYGANSANSESLPNPNDMKKYVAWVYKKFEKIYYPTLCMILSVWLYRIVFTKWTQEYISKTNENFHYDILLSLMTFPNCIGGLWFFTVFSCILIVTPVLIHNKYNLFLPSICTHILVHENVLKIMDFHNTLSYVSSVCDGNKLIYLITYFPDKIAYVLMGACTCNFYSLKHVEYYVLATFAVSEIALLSSQNTAFISLLNFLSTSSLSILTLSIERFISSSLSIVLSFIGDNSYYFYLGHILFLNMAVKEFTVATLIINIPNFRIVIFSSMSLAFGAIATWISKNVNPAPKKVLCLLLLFCIVSFKKEYSNIYTFYNQNKHVPVYQVYTDNSGNKDAYVYNSYSENEFGINKALKNKKPNVVFTLIRGKPLIENYKDYEERCKSLRKYIQTLDYEDVAFHEGDVPGDVMTHFSKLFEVRFENLFDYGAFKVPKNVKKKYIQSHDEYPTGYKNMCRFFSVQWMYVLRNYNYALRLDEDIVIEAVFVNPFLFMEIEKCQYAYALETEEKHYETVATFGAWVAKYMHAHKEPYKSVKNMYFTNFFLTRVDFWLRKDVERLLRDIDDTGNIYTFRWGDAPIQTLAVKHFLEPKYIKKYDINYLHKSTNNKIVKGREVLYVNNNIVLETENERFVKVFEDCALPCLVANYFTNTIHKTKNNAIDILKGMLALYYNLPVWMFGSYSINFICSEVQRKLYNSSLPIQNSKTMKEKLENYYDLLGINKHVSNIEKMIILKNYSCCSDFQLSKKTFTDFTQDEILMLNKLFNINK